MFKYFVLANSFHNVRVLVFSHPHQYIILKYSYLYHGGGGIQYCSSYILAIKVGISDMIELLYPFH